MEASALPASVGLTRARLGLGASLLRLRSDEQLVSLFRAGNEDAFRVIHDRYRPRMLAYARQMLASSPADAEDAVQEIFVRAYGGLRANRRDLALRAWLYRIAHNRCVDDLRRPYPIAVEAVEDFGEATGGDPHARVEQREALRRLIADVQRLPEQQRSALLMRELAGMPYADLAGALDTSVPAVKSLLVRARVGLVQASEARDTACATIREDLVVAHDRGVRASGRSRRHMRDCTECRRFRAEVQGTSARLGLLLPALGPLAAVAKLLGIGGLGGSTGAAAGSGTTAAAGGTVAAASTTAAAAGTTGAAVGASAGTVVSASAVAGAGHVATILAATAIAAGGAIGIQHEISSGQRPPARAHRIASVAALPVAPAPAGPTHAAASTGATAPSTDGGAAAATTHAPASTATGGSVDHISTLSTSAGVSGSRSATVTTGTSTSGDPTLSSDPTETTSTTATTTTSSTTTTTPTSGTTTSIGTPTTGTGTGTTPTPIPGSGTQTDPTAPTTTTPATGNPGTATGIVPTVSSATATGGSSATRRRIRLRAGRDAPRELPAGSADAR